MMPTICQQCGGPIFHYRGETPRNPNICDSCGDWDEDEIVANSAIPLMSCREFYSQRSEPDPTASPDSEAI
jgi:hypothetical protein